MNEPLPYLCEVLNIVLETPYPIEIIGNNGVVLKYYESANSIMSIHESEYAFAKVIGLEFADGHLHIVIDEEK